MDLARLLLPFDDLHSDLRVRGESRHRRRRSCRRETLRPRRDHARSHDQHRETRSRIRVGLLRSTLFPLHVPGDFRHRASRSAYAGERDD